MTAARYTSPALSRALRDAGVSQTGERFWYYDHQVSNDPFLSERAIPWGPDRFRALRLDEILEELEALRGESEINVGSATGTKGVSWAATFTLSLRVGVGRSPVEAAGYLLLAVRKAKGEKP